MADQLDLEFRLYTKERYLDFKHKARFQRRNVRRHGKHYGLRTHKDLPWVKAEMAAMAAGTVQLNIFAWNQKLTKYVKNGQSEKAMQLFQQMPQEGMSPNKFTSVQVIKACAVLGALEEGRLVHEQLIQSGCESDVFLGSSLVDIEDAWRVFNKMPS
jgi:pentatricopeptide repeat protein